MMRRLLMAFDFDHTIINDNSDIVVRNMLGQTPVPENVKQLHRTDGWTTYMQQIFRLVQGKGVSQEQIRAAVQSIPYTPGMDSLLNSLHKRGNCEVIIISDSNSVFISDWLEGASASHIVHRTFTNPAWYDEEGQLQIKMYHEQDWCKISTKNLCKGHILQSYLAERAQEGIKFDHIGYVGDGTHDLCPCLKLSSSDLAFVRQGYSLAKVIHKEKLNARLHMWETGNDILNAINASLP
jgi:pyridoxal phosphate phosphatase PHOSPHO2